MGHKHMTPHQLLKNLDTPLCTFIKRLELYKTYTSVYYTKQITFLPEKFKKGTRYLSCNILVLAVGWLLMMLL